ncbi:unnamed protein product [Haemonchus placei]|uniref:Uncharacterized protein n=1 Tax=Haemonchus placei TaxID=6290 RepID=A0A0N4WBS3_HAEPC|nr:unnamed protein product [Haemonchus placei]
MSDDRKAKSHTHFLLVIISPDEKNLNSDGPLVKDRYVTNGGTFNAFLCRSQRDLGSPSVLWRGFVSMKLTLQWLLTATIASCYKESV